MSLPDIKAPVMSKLLLLLLSFPVLADEPKQWGENVTGVVTTFHTPKKEIALTFDACGGSAKSSQYDAELIKFLNENRIPATLFINSRWIHSNPEILPPSPPIPSLKSQTTEQLTAPSRSMAKAFTILPEQPLL